MLRNYFLLRMSLEIFQKDEINLPKEVIEAKDYQYNLI